LQFLADLHQEFAPRGYVEIGVRYGSSLQLASCPAIGIDPATATLPDEFFVIRALAEGLVTAGPDGRTPQPAVAFRWEISPDALRNDAGQSF
jgi:ABC-type transport system substrate-binding protein